ncbi:hypothetical protein PV327_003193 [Microctonus hyperodae]|uniref:Uncharacterized protein n=1 Tax=Microctonus hyperodae TaxID=165561 RepID=A0AA39G4G0_MICHY|nr:hypothetical protein PV327_003193 [Microctonus hyperodae]
MELRKSSVKMLTERNRPKYSTRQQCKSRNKGVPKSSTQRSREYRLRKKLLEKCATVQNQTDTDSSVITDSFKDPLCFIKYELDISDDDLETSQSWGSNHHLNDQNDEYDSGLSYSDDNQPIKIKEEPIDEFVNDNQSIEIKEEPIDDFVNELGLSYSDDNQSSKIKQEPTDEVVNDSSKHICCLCDKSWFKKDFKYPSEHKNILKKTVAECNTCKAPFNECKLPMMSNIIFLSEICLNNYDDMSTPKLKFVIKFKRPSDPDRVSINYSQCDTVNIVTPCIEMVVTQSESYTSICHPFGEMCIAESAMANGKLIIIAMAYITPNIKIDDVIYFIHRSLLVYSHEGAAILEGGQNELPLILSGNFNMNFASEDSTRLVEFLCDKFSLFMDKELTSTMTKSDTIDTLFSRYLQNIESQIYISHLNHHKPLSSIELMPIKNIKLEEMKLEELNY